MSQGSKRYEQPYSSRHVINKTTDSIRSEEPAYIKNFPKFVNLVYRRQPPFSVTQMNYIRQQNTNSTHETKHSNTLTRKSIGNRSPDVSPSRQQGFKTMGPTAHKSPTTQITAVPSDFEHIYHYSEA